MSRLVLVADEDPTFARFLERRLERHQWAVLRAASVETAARLWMEQQPALVIITDNLAGESSDRILELLDPAVACYLPQVILLENPRWKPSQPSLWNDYLGVHRLVLPISPRQLLQAVGDALGCTIDTVHHAEAVTA
ncbi:MAG: hypothetical protein KatS3mg114_0126 [Planctomycetaceae bacterium]|nr:MAG: hypothetical protein KatS3mg114_0126 [Planctomycetaceae bacterium]